MRNDSNTSKWAVLFCLTGLMTAGPATHALAADDLDADQSAESIFEPVGDEDSGNELPEGQTLEVGSFGQIDLHVEGLELSKVLQVLSFQSRRNIIVSRNVAGTISADLYDVDFYQALDAVLHANGFGYVEKGDFIYVYTADEIERIAEDSRTLNYEVLELDYITAADASTMVSPLLSAAGSIAVNAEVSAGFQPSLSDGGENLNSRGEILAINDYEENVEAIKGALTKLDIKPKQVMVEAAVLSARLTEDNAWGVDLSVLVDFDFTEFVDPLSVIDDLLDGDVGPSGQAFTSTVGNTRSGKQGVRFGVASEHITAFVRALQDVTDVTVLAKPRLLVLNRQRADLLVGERLGYVSTTQAETTVTQTVEFLDVGTQLTVRPFVSSDDMIRMELRPSISDGSTRVEAGFVIPDQTAQELVTNVMVKSGQTVLIGGLFKEDTTISRSQVPGFGDVPLLGAAFKGQDDSIVRSEVLFLVTPTIVKDEAMANVGRRSAEMFEQQRLGMVEGLLPWSRTKVTHDHMREAVLHHEMGDDRMALHYLDMALTLDPTYAKARDLKMVITGEQMDLQDRSIMKTVIDEFIHDQDADAAAATNVEAGEVEVTDAVEETAAEAQIEAVTDEVVEDAVEEVEAGPVAVTEPAQDEQAVAEFVSDDQTAEADSVNQWVEESIAADEASAEQVVEEQATLTPAWEVEAQDDVTDAQAVEAWEAETFDAETADTAAEATTFEWTEPAADAADASEAGDGQVADADASTDDAESVEGDASDEDVAEADTTGQADEAQVSVDPSEQE